MKYENFWEKINRNLQTQNLETKQVKGHREIWKESLGESMLVLCFTIHPWKKWLPIYYGTWEQ